MVLSPSEIVEKQIRRASGAVSDYQRGVANPIRNPLDAALAAAGKYQAKMKESLDKKRWEQAIASTPKGLASEKAATIGADRYAGGVEASRDKITRFQTGFAPFREAVVRQVEGLPEDTDAQRDARVLANLKGLREAKGKWRR